MGLKVYEMNGYLISWTKNTLKISNLYVTHLNHFNYANPSIFDWIYTQFFHTNERLLLAKPVKNEIEPLQNEWIGFVQVSLGLKNTL